MNKKIDVHPDCIIKLDSIAYSLRNQLTKSQLANFAYNLGIFDTKDEFYLKLKKMVDRRLGHKIGKK